MKCSKCGTEYEGNFCPKCGTAADPNCNVCPKCGQARTDNDRFCKNCGYDYQNHQANRIGNIGTSAVAAIKRVPKKIWITIGAIIVAAAILLAILIPTISFLTNKFRVAFVDQIKIGDSRERVLELLGEPYEYDENSTTYEYYSDNYLALLEENDSFDPDSVQDWNDLESAFEDALELEQKLQTEEYAYIAITFDSEGRVSSVFFDPTRTEETKNQTKEVENYNIVSTLENAIQSQMYYQDGSYALDIYSANIYQNNILTYIEWVDRYGNDLSETIGEHDLSQYGSEVGDFCPDFMVQVYDNATGELTEEIYSPYISRGKVTVIYFWGTWCQPCREELPYFDQIASEYTDVDVVAVHSILTMEEAPEYISTNYTNSNMVFTQDSIQPQMDGSEYNVFALLGGRNSYPLTVIINAEGMITFTYDDSINYETLVTEIEKAKN